MVVITMYSRPSWLITMAALMYGSANAVRQVYTMCDEDGPNKAIFDSDNMEVEIRLPDLSEEDYRPFCSFVLGSGRDPLILRFTFNELNIKSSHRCSAHYLCLHDAILCGSSYRTSLIEQMLPPLSSSTLVFYNNDGDASSAFQVVVSARKADDNEVAVEPIGVWSDSKNGFTHVTYRPELRYFDTCARDLPPPTKRPIITTKTLQNYTLCNVLRPNNVTIATGDYQAIFSSPDVEAMYSINCPFIIHSADVPLILTFQFKKLVLDYDPKCARNYICIHGIKLCGRGLKGYDLTYILPESSTSTIYYYRDNHQSPQEFEMVMTVREAKDKEVVLEPFEIWSSPAAIYYTPIRYTPGMEYSDYCQRYVRH